MYQLEVGSSLQHAEQSAGPELGLPYDLTPEEYAQLQDPVKVAVALKIERMQQAFENTEALFTNLTEVTNLDRDKLIAANKFLVQMHNGDKYAELVRTEKGLLFGLTSYGQDYLDANIGKLRYGST
jgi:hypothetical protein